MNTMIKQILVYGAILLALGSLVLLLLLNYSMVYALIAGCFSAYLITRLPRVIEKISSLELKLLSKAPVIGRILARLISNIVGIFLLLFAIFALMNYSIQYQRSSCGVRSRCRISASDPFFNDVPPQDCYDGPIAEEYDVTIRTDPNAKDRFLVKDVFINPCPSKLKTILNHKSAENIIVELTERQVTSISRGLLLKELIYSPQNVTSKTIDIPLSNGYHVVGNTLCSLNNVCPKINVTLQNFPKGTFYAAKASFDMQSTTYIDVENVSWSIYPNEEQVVFAYIPEPLQYIRPLILPFVGVSSLSHLLVALLSLAGTLILTPIVRPVITEQLQKGFLNWLRRPRWDKAEKSGSPPGPQSKAKLIISAKGEEKEIDVNRENKGG